jgi:hypothetical protein
MEEFYSPLVSAGPNLWSRSTGVVGYASMGWESAGEGFFAFQARNQEHGYNEHRRTGGREQDALKPGLNRDRENHGGGHHNTQQRNAWAHHRQRSESNDRQHDGRGDRDG